MADALRELTAERIVARMTQETALHSRLQDQLREAEDEIAAAQERQRLRRQLEDRMEFTTQQRLLLERKQRRRASIDSDNMLSPLPHAFWSASSHASLSSGAPPSTATSAETTCPSLAA